MPSASTGNTPYGGTFGQKLLDNTCQIRTGGYEEDVVRDGLIETSRCVA